MVTTSNLVLVNMADFGDDFEIEGDVLAAKRSHVDDYTFAGESDGPSGTLASTEGDADVMSKKRKRRGAYHQHRPPKKKNPLAFIQLSLTLQSESKKLQLLATRGFGVSKTEWDRVCKAAIKAISLLQLGSRASDVAATLTSHVTGKRRTARR